jgi:hypothetical protein
MEPWPRSNLGTRNVFRKVVSAPGWSDSGRDLLLLSCSSFGANTGCTGSRKGHLADVVNRNVDRTVNWTLPAENCTSTRWCLLNQGVRTVVFDRKWCKSGPVMGFRSRGIVPVSLHLLVVIQWLWPLQASYIIQVCWWCLPFEYLLIMIEIMRSAEVRTILRVPFRRGSCAYGMSNKMSDSMCYCIFCRRREQFLRRRQ